MTDWTPAFGPTSHSFVSQRLRLHYVDWGNRDAPAVVLLHGGRDHCRSWDWLAQALKKNFHLIAPDLRGHGDSAPSPSGDYSMSAFLYDLAQLIHGQRLAPVSILAHSLGGAIALRYAGVYPNRVRRLIAIEGLGPSPKMIAERAAITVQERMRGWIRQERALAARQPRRYASIEEALERTRTENPRLSEAQARHLTHHGVAQNEDGTYGWKFDNYVRSFSAVDLTHAQVAELWSRITCPTLLVYGAESWASNPAEDGRLAHFASARVSCFEGAGHWVHHDRLDAFAREARAFLMEE